MKSVMSAQKIPLRNKIYSALSIYRAYKNQSFLSVKRVIKRHHELLCYLDEYVGLPVEKTRFLDLGCGQRANQVILFHADGAKAVGIDIEMPTFKLNLPIFLKIIRLNGMERALKSLTRHVLFDKRFFSELSREYGKPITLNGIDIRIMDATNLTFDSNSFDFIFSGVVFQHIDNVESAVKEVNRVLTPEGLAVISIHLYPSISGGMCLEWANPDEVPSTKVPPWDHLRENKYPANVYLNKLKINQYREIFRSYTNVVKEETVTEGEKLLTRKIEEELGNRGYTREDLLTKKITFFARKKLIKQSR